MFVAFFEHLLLDSLADSELHNTLRVVNETTFILLQPRVVLEILGFNAKQTHMAYVCCCDLESISLTCLSITHRLSSLMTETAKIHLRQGRIHYEYGQTQTSYI